MFFFKLCHKVCRRVFKVHFLSLSLKFSFLLVSLFYQWSDISVYANCSYFSLCYFLKSTFWNHQYRLDSTKSNRDQSAWPVDGKTSYRGHENLYHTSNGHYSLTAMGRDAESICYVRCVALHVSRRNKYPSAWNTVVITLFYRTISLVNFWKRVSHWLCQNLTHYTYYRILRTILSRYNTR